MTSPRCSLFIILLCLCAPFVWAEEAPINVEVVGDWHYPPYSFNLDGKPSGLYVEILNEVFKKLDGYKVTIRLMPWKRALKAIEDGRNLAIFPPYRWPKARPYMSPYSEPIYLEEVVVFCQKSVFEKKARRKWPESYFGLRFVNALGFLFPGKAFFKAVGMGNITKTDVTDAKTAIRMLVAGRVDCHANERETVRWEIKNLFGVEALKLIREGITISSQWGYLAYSNQDKQNQFGYKQDFVSKVDIIIRDMKASGRIDEIADQYLKRSN